VLEAVERAVKLTIGRYGPAQNYFDNPEQGHGLMFLDVLEWLYRLTGAEEYRRAALSLYGDYNASATTENEDAQLARLMDPKIPLSGHGPDVMGFLRVPLLCYYLSGKPVYRQAFDRFVPRRKVIWVSAARLCPAKTRRSRRKTRGRICLTSIARRST
jgi:hypothetical protein